MSFSFLTNTNKQATDQPGGTVGNVYTGQVVGQSVSPVPCFVHADVHFAYHFMRKHTEQTSVDADWASKPF